MSWLHGGATRLSQYQLRLDDDALGGLDFRFSIKLLKNELGGASPYDFQIPAQRGNRRAEELR